MSDDFIPTGRRSPEQIQATLQEIEGVREAAGDDLEGVSDAQFAF